MIVTINHGAGLDLLPDYCLLLVRRLQLIILIPIVGKRLASN